MGETLYWLVSYWIELIKIYFILTYIFRCKMRSHMEPTIAVFSMVILWLPRVIFNKTYLSGCIVCITMMTVLIMLYRKREMILAIFGFSIISIIDVGIGGIIGNLLNFRTEEILKDYLISILLNMQSLVPLMLLIRFFNKKKTLPSTSYGDKSLKRILLITIGLFFVILLFVPFQIHDLDVNSQQHKISLLALTVSVFSFVGMAIVNVIVMIRNEQKEKDNTAYQYLLEKQKQLYGNILEHENEIRRFRHDIYHHMNCIRKYLEQDQLESAGSYIDSIYGVVNYSYFVSTGNLCLDIVINDVWKEYRESIMVL